MRMAPRKPRRSLAAVIVALGVCFCTPAAQSSAGGTFKVAFYNIKSGKGQVALPGFRATFADTSNCTNPQLPLNAWGVGLVQSVLRSEVAADPDIVQEPVVLWLRVLRSSCAAAKSGSQPGATNAELRASLSRGCGAHLREPEAWG